VKRILDLSMKEVGQLVGEPTRRRLIDKGLDRGDESAVAGKSNSVVGPQAHIVEAGNFAEGIVAAAMRIAGQVIEEFELAKDGEVGRGADGIFEFG
jgi:hypothetical protein